MNTEYEIEIYEPDDKQCIAGYHKSDSPFASPVAGDIISYGSLNLSDENRNLEVVKIKHIYTSKESDLNTHKICVYTKLAE